MTSGRIASARARRIGRHLAGTAALAVLAATAFATTSYVIGAFSAGTPGGPLPAGWEPLTFKHIDRHTQYTLVRDPEAGVVVRALAAQSASGLQYALAFPAQERPSLTWRWKVDNVIAGGDLRRKEGDDYPARIYVSFRYTPERLSVVDRVKYAAARILYGEYPPHAGLNYIWDTHAPVGTQARNPFTNRVQMIVVESGTGRVGQWVSYERDIIADYRQAFGEDPPPISGVALMTDADNTGESAVAYYGDIALSPKTRSASRPSIMAASKSVPRL
jgi:Protein of unknown function (DUF3047)